MKKILLSVTLAAATNINAQLVVDSLGRVGIIRLAHHVPSLSQRKTAIWS